MNEKLINLRKKINSKFKFEFKQKRFGANLTHSFPVHLFSTCWKHQKTLRFSDAFPLKAEKLEKGCIEKKQVKGLGLNLLNAIFKTKLTFKSKLT